MNPIPKPINAGAASSPSRTGANRQRSAPPLMPRLAALFAVCAGTSLLPLPAAEFGLALRPTNPLELGWNSETGFQYQIEASPSAAQPDWKPLGTALPGTGGPLSITVPADLAHRFFRAVRTQAPTQQISPQAVEPLPGQVHPAGTQIGSPFLGLQFTIPAAWKGGVRQGSSTMLYASDTEPGFVIGFISLAGNATSIAAGIGGSFAVGQFGGFQPAGTPQVNGNVITVNWDGVGFDDQFNSLTGTHARCQATVHPSGGVIAFIGFFTDANRTVMDRVLGDFTGSVVTVPRRTRTDLVGLISGKAFVWVKSSNVGNGGNYGSLQSWTQKNAFFCPGTYEITTRSESSYSGNLSGGGFYSGGSSSNSTEAGDWTIIDTDAGPAMVMISSSGAEAALLQISGNSVYFGQQQFDFMRFHQCPGQ